MTRSTWALLTTMFALLVSGAVFHVSIQRALASRLLLNVDSPTDEFFTEVARNAKDPVRFLERCWATGKVRHRALVAGFLKDSASAHEPWLPRAEPLVLACTTDADASVREMGLATLETEHNPLLLNAAHAQLDNLDPMIRLLGVECVRKSPQQARAVPILMRVLDDPDLRIVTAAEVALMRMSGEDFGVKAVQAISPEGSSGQVTPENLEAIRRGVERRKEWWQLHQSEYASSTLNSQPILPVMSDLTRRPCPDFGLTDLQGQTIRLSDLRGRVVVLNFWASWCTACLAEIPDLVALQKEMGTRVAIIGVALDGVPDEDGDMPGAPGEDYSHNTRPTLDSIRAKVDRAVKARRITYPVALDPRNSLGGQYNGGELPTTVIIDSQGRVRRRFVGERNVEVLRAMVLQSAEAKPVAAAKP